MKKERETRVARAIRRTVPRPGVVVGVCCALAAKVGKFLGEGSKILGRFSGLLKGSPRKQKPPSAPERIRSIVADELQRLGIAAGTIPTGELEERLRVMAEAIEALRERIAALRARGPVSEADMWQTVGSLKAADSLNDEERAILVNVFRQNVAIQKPNLVSTPSTQTSLEVLSS